MFIIQIEQRGTIQGRPAYITYSEDGLTEWTTNDQTEVSAKLKELAGTHILGSLKVLIRCAVDVDFNISVDIPGTGPIY